jgi:hypothetical protein
MASGSSLACLEWLIIFGELWVSIEEFPIYQGLLIADLIVVTVNTYI